MMNSALKTMKFSLTTMNFGRLHAFDAQKRERIERKREALAAREVDHGFTFKPAVSKGSKKLNKTAAVVETQAEKIERLHEWEKQKRERIDTKRQQQQDAEIAKLALMKVKAGKGSAKLAGKRTGNVSDRLYTSAVDSRVNKVRFSCVFEISTVGQVHVPLLVSYSGVVHVLHSFSRDVPERLLVVILLMKNELWFLLKMMIFRWQW